MINNFTTLFTNNIFAFITGIICFINMASPVHEGTSSSSPLSSRDIDITKEKLTVTIGKNFDNAEFSAEYYINTSQEGMQIPLMFIAKDINGKFNVTCDGIIASVKEIPPGYYRTSDSLFKNFPDFIKNSGDNENSEDIILQWGKDTYRNYRLSDLRYFEVNLSKGNHIIKAEYTANAWSDRSDWVKQYSFRYSLAPAEFWKSFQNLEIVIDARNFGKNVTANIGIPHSGSLDSVAEWNFSSVPAELLQINYTPETSFAAKVMMYITPVEISAAAGILLFAFHFAVIYYFRKKNPSKKNFLIIISGSIIIPLLILLVYLFSYEFTDFLIGADAGKYHGYTILIMFLYPLMIPVHYFLMWLFVRMFIKKPESVSL